MSDPDEKDPYLVKPDRGKFSIVDDEGSTQLVCGDEANAKQYAALMNAAYRRGYRAGVRKGRVR